MRWPLTMLSAVISFPGRMDCYGRTRAACRLPRRCVRRRRREDRSAQKHPPRDTRPDRRVKTPKACREQSARGRRRSRLMASPGIRASLSFLPCREIAAIRLDRGAEGSLSAVVVCGCVGGPLRRPGDGRLWQRGSVPLARREQVARDRLWLAAARSAGRVPAAAA